MEISLDLITEGKETINEKISEIERMMKEIKEEFLKGNDLVVEWSWRGVFTDGHPVRPQYWVNSTHVISCGDKKLSITVRIPSSPVCMSYYGFPDVEHMVKALVEWARENRRIEGLPEDAELVDAYEETEYYYSEKEQKEYRVVTEEYKESSGCGFKNTYLKIYATAKAVPEEE